MKTLGAGIAAAVAAWLVLLGVTAIVEGAEPKRDVLVPIDAPSNVQTDRDFCDGLIFYGGVDAFIDYMNEGNPTPMAPEVEQAVRDKANDCS